MRALEVVGGTWRLEPRIGEEGDAGVGASTIARLSEQYTGTLWQLWVGSGREGVFGKEKAEADKLLRR